MCDIINTTYKNWGVFMECEKLFAEIDKLYDKYIKVWSDVCNIESPTGYKKGVDAVGKYFSEMAQSLGFEVEIFPQNKSGDIVTIKMNDKSPEKPIIFSGHTDTVHPLGLFGKPAVRMDDEKIYGPGVMDCKGGVVASFMAMEALKNIGFEKRGVWLILQTDEEVGSKQSNKETINFICEKSKDAIGFINTEGNVAGTAVLETKGILRYSFFVKGISAHSSLCHKGANAVLEAAHKIIELEKMKDIEGLTCNCAVIKGGTAPNTVAEECTFIADIRFADKEQLKKARRIAKEISEKIHINGCSCVLKEESFRPAMEKSDKNDNFFGKANDIYERNGMSPLKRRRDMGGTDAAYVTNAGIPCFDGVGVQGGKIHSGKEYAYLSSLKLSAKQLTSVAYCI